MKLILRSPFSTNMSLKAFHSFYSEIVITQTLFTITFFQSPVNCEDEKTVCCLCCATGPITVSCNTDKRAYVPGETIYISAVLNNHSNRSVHSLEAELIQVRLQYPVNPSLTVCNSYIVIVYDCFVLLAFHINQNERGY